MTDSDDPKAWQPPAGPIGPAPGLQYAGFWIRTFAYLLDTLILFAIGFAVWYATGMAFVTVQTQEFHSGTFTSVSVIASPTLPGFLMSLIYFVGLWALRGQTLGMATLGLRILRASDGSRIGPGRAVGRFFGLILSFFALLIGVIWVAADSRKQGWHDKLARTVVVRPSRVSGPAVPAGP